jgi:hypothetical protein
MTRRPVYLCHPVDVKTRDDGSHPFAFVEFKEMKSALAAKEELEFRVRNEQSSAWLLET